MKKVIMIMALLMGLVISADAQKYLVDNGTLKDNWYVGAGVGTNVWNDGNSWTLFNAKSGVVDGKTNSWWRTQPIHANLTVGKMFNPYLGAEIDYAMVFNVRGANTFLDAHNLTANAVLNLTNIIAGYNGKQRFLEFELLGGAGWLHNYTENLTNGASTDANAMSVRGAVRADLNVSKSLAITVTPEYIWVPKFVGDASSNKHGVNLSVGLKYRIPSKRGYFPKRKLYDKEEVNALNAKIKAMDGEIASLTKANADLAETIKKLVAQGEKVVVKTQSVEQVFFKQGKSEVSDSELAKVVKVLKETKGKITLTGTTSPEGREKLNKLLGINRANALKEALIANGIDASRIVLKNDYENQRSVVITVE